MVQNISKYLIIPLIVFVVLWIPRFQSFFFSDLLIDRRIKLAGHILRCEDNDPLRRVSYEPNSAETFNVGKRRVGGPRQQWTQYANKYAWENVLRKGRYENGANQNQELLISARSRHF